MNPISCIIITYNEEGSIKDCLESIKWVDEIIVVDSGSSDKTIEIAKEYTDKVFHKEWMGYGKQKEYARQMASLNWVLSIDADERISEKLKDEILKSGVWSLKSGVKKEDAYYIPRKLFFLGKLLRFGGCSDKQIRLFRKEKAKFSDDIIHEKVIVDGKIGRLKNPIFHYSYKNILDYFERFNKYSTLEAEKIVRSQGVRGSGGQRSNILFVFQVFLCFIDFLKRYIFKLGMLDGIQGFLWALFSSFHRLVKYAKVLEIKQK
ncbi:MAG: glycosyltransferase family 2 protein [bacterium]